MNGKKAKAIRNLFRDKLYDSDGKYIKNYGLKIGHTVQKLRYERDLKGILTTKTIDCHTYLNESKNEYRRAKKQYKNGDFEIK